MEDGSANEMEKRTFSSSEGASKACSFLLYVCLLFWKEDPGQNPRLHSDPVWMQAPPSPKIVTHSDMEEGLAPELERHAGSLCHPEKASLGGGSFLGPLTPRSPSRRKLKEEPRTSKPRAHSWPGFLIRLGGSCSSSEQVSFHSVIRGMVLRSTWFEVRG